VKGEEASLAGGGLTDADYPTNRPPQRAEAVEACGKVQGLRRAPAGRRARAAVVLPAVLRKVLVMPKPIHKRTAGGAYGPLAMTFCGRTVKLLGKRDRNQVPPVLTSPWPTPLQASGVKGKSWRKRGRLNAT